MIISRKWELRERRGAKKRVDEENVVLKSDCGQRKRVTSEGLCEACDGETEEEVAPYRRIRGFKTEAISRTASADTG